MKLRADPDYLEGVDSLQKPIVVISFEDDTGLHCVDVLEIPGQGLDFENFVEIRKILMVGCIPA